MRKIIYIVKVYFKKNYPDPPAFEEWHSTAGTFPITFYYHFPF